MQEKNVIAEVISSECKLYQEGDKMVIEGPLLNKEESGNVCITALQSFFPFIFALRKQVTPQELGFEKDVEVQCPDYCAPVVFRLTAR